MSEEWNVHYYKHESRNIIVKQKRYSEFYSMKPGQEDWKLDWDAGDRVLFHTDYDPISEEEAKNLFEEYKKK